MNKISTYLRKREEKAETKESGETKQIYRNNSPTLYIKKASLSVKTIDRLQNTVTESYKSVEKSVESPACSSICRCGCMDYHRNNYNY